MLPFAAKLGYEVPAFDFSVPGVTSISVDLHKYGYAAKGASVILYWDKALRRRQFFIHTDWSGGIYASPGIGGTRPGGAIAAAWAIMNYLGEEGYLTIAETVMQTTEKIRKGVEAIPGLAILGDPPMSVLAIGSDNLNIYEVGDELGQQGWHLDRQQFPPSLHLTVTYAHAAVVDRFLDDLTIAAKNAKKVRLSSLATSIQVGLVKAAASILPEKMMSDLTARVSALIGVGGGNMPERSAAIYGMMANLPNRGDLDEMVLDILDNLTHVEGPDQS
jgi:glutamate/tyrosine decarboxylase-like PLP-dependent enzyme